MRLMMSLLAGAIFGLGLVVSGMTDTSKVQGWLDFFGAWDPTLAFVLGGAIVPMVVAWWAAEGRTASALGTPFPTPSDPILDRPLIVGSALFGFGWALVGLCPGPAMASLSFGGPSGVVFFAAMAVGMFAKTQLPARVVA